VVKVRQRVLGGEHPETLVAIANLAHIKALLGDLDGARELEDRVLEVRHRVLGPRHPEMSVLEWNLLQERLDRKDEAGARELVKRLAWLVDAEDGALSAEQRKIRDELLKAAAQ
jgi:hypothetical protein